MRRAVVIGVISRYVRNMNQLAFKTLGEKTLRSLVAGMMRAKYQLGEVEDALGRVLGRFGL